MSVSILQSYEFPPVPPNKSTPPLSSPANFPRKATLLKFPTFPAAFPSASPSRRTADYCGHDRQAIICGSARKIFSLHEIHGEYPRNPWELPDNLKIYFNNLRSLQSFSNTPI